METIRAVVFDLYGTLIRIHTEDFCRFLCGLLAVAVPFFSGTCIGNT